MMDIMILLFQSRNGLIWTRMMPRSALPLTTFQSRNGLIWTRLHYKWRWISKNFNPATVWFEPLKHNYWWVYNKISIPQRSDLNSLTEGNTCLQGVISIPQRSDLNANNCCAWVSSNCISIPQRSDLNVRRRISVLRARRFQSRNGLIWTRLTINPPQSFPIFQSRNGLIWTH